MKITISFFCKGAASFPGDGAFFFPHDNCTASDDARISLRGVFSSKGNGAGMTLIRGAFS